MKNDKRFRAVAIAVLAVAAVTGLAACSGADGDSTAPTPEPTASDYVPDVTDEGTALVSGIADCAHLASNFGALTEGLELSLESLDDGAVFCDWVAADDENHFVSIEILGSTAEAIPTADAVAASGGSVIEIANVTEAGGIAYSIAGADGAAYSLTAVVPEYSVSVTAIGGALGDEQIQQITAGVEALVG